MSPKNLYVYFISTYINSKIILYIGLILRILLFGLSIVRIDSLIKVWNLKITAYNFKKLSQYYSTIEQILLSFTIVLQLGNYDILISLIIFVLLYEFKKKKNLEDTENLSFENMIVKTEYFLKVVFYFVLCNFSAMTILKSN